MAKQSDTVSKRKANTPARLALFGGSFDPIHCAHLEIARCALKQAELDRVIFVPTSQSPFKSNKPGSGDTMRVQMLNLAIQEEADFEVSTHETEQGGVNYTIDTVLHFQAYYKNAEFFLVIGGDQFEQLERWYRIHELARRVTFLVYPRPDASDPPLNSVANISYCEIKAPLMEISSTLIRKRCKEGLSLKGLVPDAVEAFIFSHKLYK